MRSIIFFWFLAMVSSSLFATVTVVDEVRPFKEVGFRAAEATVTSFRVGEPPEEVSKITTTLSPSTTPRQLSLESLEDADTATARPTTSHRVTPYPNGDEEDEEISGTINPLSAAARHHAAISMPNHTTESEPKTAICSLRTNNLVSAIKIASASAVATLALQLCLASKDPYEKLLFGTALATMGLDDIFSVLSLVANTPKAITLNRGLSAASTLVGAAALATEQGMRKGKTMFTSTPDMAMCIMLAYFSVGIIAFVSNCLTH